MLPYPDRSLCDRDPALPGLALLLDSTRLSAWGSELLGRAVTVRRQYLRYKPGTSCVLYADADGLPLLISAGRPASPEKHRKIVARAGENVLGQDHALGVLVGTPAADRHLRALAPLMDPARRPDALHRLGLGQEYAATDHLTLLRYKPHRRHVLLIRPDDAPPALVRVYERGGARAGASRLSELRGNGGLHTPGLLGRDFRRDALAVEYLPGHPVDGAPAGDFAAAGEALARLHGLRGLRLRRHSAAEEIRATRAAARHLGVLLPELAGDAQLIADRIVAGLQHHRGVARPVHGDFSADQAIRQPDASIALIDLDAACIADPATDLGSAAAALLRDRSLGLLSDQGCAERHQALLAGYADAAGPINAERLAVHTAAHVLRRSYEPFRLAQHARWDEVAAELLEAAGNTLAGAEGVAC